MDMKTVEAVIRMTVGRLEGMAALTDRETMSDSLLCWAEELAHCLQVTDCGGCGECGKDKGNDNAYDV